MPPVDRLIAAAQAGQVAEVRSLVTADPGLLTARSMFGAGAVHAAHYAGQDAVLAVLAELGLVTDGFLAAELGRGPELRAALAADPLHAACWRGLGRVAGELLSVGADPALTATDGPHQGETPAATARAQGHDDLAARLDAAG
jgi:hypothetical protein